MNIKIIKGLKNHYISDTGEVYSNYCNKMKKLKQYVDSRGLYMMITISENGIRHKFLIHRLVAEAFIPNPNNLPEVNHKDFNHKRNVAENLEWCTRQYNNNHMFEQKSNVRNYRECTLINNGNVIQHCKSINEACRIASELFNVSYSSLNRNKKAGSVEIIFDRTSNDYPIGE